MKLFQRQERPQAPQISISLDQDCAQPFRPGSRVAGTIALSSPTPRDLIHAEAIFFGRVVTHCTRTESQGNSFHRRANFSYNETIHYHDDACLFRFTQALSTNDTIEANRPRTFRFDFVFGHEAKLVGRSPYHGPTASAGIYAGVQHPLPPAFERYFNDHHYGFIEYRVQAVFQMLDSAEPFTMHLPLTFYPTAQWPDPLSTVEFVKPPEIFASTKLLGAQTSPNTLDKSVEITMKASLNPQAICTSTLPIYLCVEMRTPSPPPASAPQINFKVKSATLYQITFFRARHVRGFTNVREYQEIGEDGIPLDAKPANITAAPKVKDSGEGSFVFFPATFEVRIPETISPSFSTFNINHNYQLRVVAEAKVAGKRFEQQFIVPSFTVLPPG